MRLGDNHVSLFMYVNALTLILRLYSDQGIIYRIYS